MCRYDRSNRFCKCDFDYKKLLVRLSETVASHHRPYPEQVREGDLWTWWPSLTCLLLSPPPRALTHSCLAQLLAPLSREPSTRGFRRRRPQKLSIRPITLALRPRAEGSLARAFVQKPTTYAFIQRANYNYSCLPSASVPRIFYSSHNISPPSASGGFTY